MSQSEFIVRAIDVGRGNTKFTQAVRGDGRVVCGTFPSIAVPRDNFREGDTRASSQKTVGIPIDGLIYEVGQDVHLAADVFNANVLQHDRYTETPEYLALTRGALASMDVAQVDLLVVGLPVSTMKMKPIVDHVEKLLCGQHDIGMGKKIAVKRVKTIAQPSGSLMYYGASHNRFAEIRNERSLIIDPGRRTFDWIVTQGMRTIEKRSSSLARGMFDVLKAVAERVGTVVGCNYREYELIDQALRSGRKLTVFEKDHDLEQYLGLARTIPMQAIAEMSHYVGDASDIRNIVMSGGGAFFFRQALRDQFPNHTVHELKEPIFANVRGFQLAGQEFAKSFDRDARRTLEHTTSESSNG